MNVEEKHNPIQQGERIEVVDILRGLALLGIILANMAHFSTPIIYVQLTEMEIWTAVWDKWVQGVLTIFVEGKFYTLFSFLFGWGFILFMERAAEKVERPRLLYLRRLAVLFCFGLIHAYLIWYGDILILYSVTGLVLLLFYSRKPRTLLLWAVIFTVLSVLPILLMILGAAQMDAAQVREWVSTNQPIMEEMQRRVESSYHAYGAGTFAELMQQRVQDVQFMLSYAIFTIPMILPMFLIGAYVGKRKIFQHVPEYLPLIKKVWLVSFVLGFGLNVLKFISLQQLDIHIPTQHDLFVQVGMAIGDPALSIFYMTTIVLRLQNSEWRTRFTFLAPVGQMAFSNYLLQSVICTIIFYSYGFGLYGQLGPALSSMLALLVFTVQVVLSQLWLRKYRFGPLEWVWRRLTYGRIQLKG